MFLKVKKSVIPTEYSVLVLVAYALSTLISVVHFVTFGSVTKKH